MTSQFATPLLLHTDGTTEGLRRIALGATADGSGYDEAWLEGLLFEHPETLPIREIDSSYADPIPVCTQLSTRVGPLDILYVTAEGRLVIVEAKLWRNPEARRKVIAQVLDYAAELSRWSYEDLQREVARRTGQGRDALFAIASEGAPEIDEADFIDNVSRSLREGRFLLLVCGDGIREELARIAEFLDCNTTLDLTFGLVELAIFAARDGARLVQPRVLAKTVTLRRQVLRIEGGEAKIVDESEEPEDTSEADEGRARMYRFWSELLDQIRLDDPAQPLPNPFRKSDIQFGLHSRETGVVLYFSKREPSIGLFLAFRRGEPGDTFWQHLCDEREAISAELPGDVEWTSDGTRHRIIVSRPMPAIDDAEGRVEAIKWFSENANTFINVFRPRIGRYQEEL